jgi:hypothetical protein
LRSQIGRQSDQFYRQSAQASWCHLSAAVRWRRGTARPGRRPGRSAVTWMITRRRTWTPARRPSRTRPRAGTVTASGVRLGPESLPVTVGHCYRYYSCQLSSRPWHCHGHGFRQGDSVTRTIMMITFVTVVSDVCAGVPGLSDRNLSHGLTSGRLGHVI